MQLSSTLCVASLSAVVALASCQAAGPRSEAWTAYFGQTVDNSLPEEILLLHKLEPEDAYLLATSYSRVIERAASGRHQWEWEANLARNFGEQRNWELNSGLAWRWNSWPWNDAMRTSAAVTNGLSLASEVPALEDADEPETGSNELLYFLVLELEFAPPSWKHWSWVLRVHHRSGVFGLFDGVSGGSNVLALGLKYAW